MYLHSQSLLEFWDSIISERHKDYVAIKAERDKTAAALYAAVQRRHVIELAADFFLTEAARADWSGARSEAAGGVGFATSASAQSRSAIGGRGVDVEAASATSADDDGMAFKHIAGILATEDRERFARIVFRASAGHAVVRWADVPGTLVDTDGVEQAKSVFAVFFRGRTLGGKLARICTAFSAATHDIPNFAHEREVAASLDETKGVIADSIAWLSAERDSSSATLRHLALLLRKWRIGILREKSIAHTLNCCTRNPDRGNITAQAWVLKDAVAGVRSTIEEVHSAAAEGGRLAPFLFEVLPAAEAKSIPPTHFNTNR